MDYLGVDYKMSLEEILEPEFDELVNFKEGMLVVPGKDEGANQEQARIYYGRYTTEKIDTVFLYMLPLDDLKKVEKDLQTSEFMKVDDNTVARKTSTHGIEIKRVSGTLGYGVSTAVFSKEEYETIRKYF